MDGHAATLEDLQNVARRLWDELPPGAVVWLTGDLGSGKTTFAQAVAEIADAGTARSPTYALVHEYVSPEGPLIHVDCYRLRDASEAIDLDFPGLMKTARLLMIEWPERGGAYVPPPTVHLRFTHVEAPDRRRIEEVR